jgi:hypothetical protein
MKFFSQGTVPTDPIYARTLTSSSEPHPQAREYLEQLYAENAPFLDPDLAERAPTNGLASAFFEMYVAQILRANGLALVPRSRRVPKLTGPDLLAEHPQVWIEAVTAQRGVGPDGLRSPEPGKVYDVPTTAYILRLRSAIEYKAEQLKHHIQLGYIKDGQAAVIAVSGALLEFRYSELPVPRIVRALFGVGDLVLEIDRTSGATSGYSVEYRDEVTKSRGASVPTDLFLHPGYAHVSAVMYSPSCWVCHPYVPGADFAVVHNPHARTPLPDGWLPVGDEYWLDASGVRHTRHPLTEHVACPD